MKMVAILLGIICLAAAVAYFVVNFALVATAIALRTRTSIRSVIRANLRYQAAASVVLFAAAPLIAVAMGTGSPFVVGLFIFPLATIYLSAAMSVHAKGR